MGRHSFIDCLLGFMKEYRRTQKSVKGLLQRLSH